MIGQLITENQISLGDEMPQDHNHSIAATSIPFGVGLPPIKLVFWIEAEECLLKYWTSSVTA